MRPETGYSEVTVGSERAILSLRGSPISETRRTHWQRVYTDKAPTDVSWYQPVPEKPLHLIRETSIARAEPILDVGGGASTLVDHLHADGYTDITVMDISGKALERSRARLGETADVMNWIESDVTAFEPRRRYALWHDRAAFHFLTDATDRDKYIDIVERALKPGGYLVLATFGPEGPERCSGLENRRYGIEQLQELFGGEFN